MQLVRNLYTRRARRAPSSARSARPSSPRSSRTATPAGAARQWILNKYLNSVPYGTVGGQTALGIQAAARIFFDKPAADAEAPRGRAARRPPAGALAVQPVPGRREGAAPRRNDVLQRMADQGYIKQETADRTKAMALGVKSNRYFTARREGYFFDYVKQQLIDDPDSAWTACGAAGCASTRRSTCACRRRRARRWTASSAIPTARRRSSRSTRAPATSRRWPRRRSYGDSKFNLAAQGHRQPGSTFKTMVLMAALRRGVDPTRTTYTSKPLRKGWLPTRRPTTRSRPTPTTTPAA